MDTRSLEVGSNGSQPEQGADALNSMDQTAISSFDWGNTTTSDDGSDWLDMALQIAMAQPDSADSKQARPAQTYQSMSASMSMPDEAAASKPRLDKLHEQVVTVTKQARESSPMTLGLLNRAAVCAQLASRAYKDEPLFEAGKDQLKWKGLLPSIKMPKGCQLDKPLPDSFEASLVKWHKSQEYTTVEDFITKENLKTGLQSYSAAAFITWLQDNSEKYLPFIQWAIWYVEDLGYVTAFKGSTDAEDWLANFLITDKKLEHDPKVTVHAGMYSRVQVAWEGAKETEEGILHFIKQDAELHPERCRRDGQIPVLLTGHSLGGGYSTTLLLHLLALKSSAANTSLDRIQLEGAVTFGAPLTLVQAATPGDAPEGNSNVSFNAALKLLAGCRLHNFVNGKDLVPRSLGRALGNVIDVVQASYKAASVLSIFVLSKRWGNLLKDADSKAGIDGVVKWAMRMLEDLEEKQSGYLPLGTYHLLLAGRLDNCNSAEQPELLDLGVKEMLPGTTNVWAFTKSLCDSSSLANKFDTEFVYAHKMQHPEEPLNQKDVIKRYAPTYTSSLEAVFKRMRLGKSPVNLRLGWSSDPQESLSVGSIHLQEEANLLFQGGMTADFGTPCLWRKLRGLKKASDFPVAVPVQQHAIFKSMASDFRDKLSPARLVGEEVEGSLAVEQKLASKQELNEYWDQEEEELPFWSDMVSKDLDELLLDIVSLGTGPSVVHQLALLGSSKSPGSEYACTRLQAVFEGLQSTVKGVCESLKAELQKPGQLQSGKQSDICSLLDEVLLRHGDLLTSAGKNGRQMDRKAASRMREGANKLINLVHARLHEAFYPEPKAEDRTYASFLPEPLQELRARFSLHLVWAVGALFQDMADESMQRSGKESSTLCGHMQHSLAEALSGMSIYNMARPATQTLLADYKCLVSSLKQDWQSSKTGNGMAAGVLTMPELLWDDGLFSLSKILEGLHPEEPGSSSELARPITLLTQAEVDCMAAYSAVPGRNPEFAERTGQPDNQVRDMLLELGMPPDAATRCCTRLMRDTAQVEVVKSVVRPCFRWQLETYMRCEFGSADLVCAVPRTLPPVAPCWGKINASTDGATDFISATAALGRYAWSGVSIASFETDAGGQEVGGWSFMDERFFSGEQGRQVTGDGDGQILLNPQDFDWVLASSGIPANAVPVGRDSLGESIYSAVCRQKHDKRSFIAGKARDVTKGSCATYSLDGTEVVPYAGEGYVMCHKGSMADAKLSKQEMKWCFQEQPVGLVAYPLRTSMVY
ncbi:hypothetical protein WJX74_006440 [Apatococcus lobatus]|uniref:Fungal lipase-type domain-containing protein n=1 Tax=Apatococcus lobatus TaxID=904363 RepID=A0AAW1QWU9_9CHLO